jgi:hypothetical protein
MLGVADHAVGRTLQVSGVFQGIAAASRGSGDCIRR